MVHRTRNYNAGIKIQNMKNGSAARPCGVPTEVIKCGRELFGLIAYIFNHFLYGEKISKEWKESFIIKIHKKTDRKKLFNYKAMSVANCLGRIYCRIRK